MRYEMTFDGIPASKPFVIAPECHENGPESDAEAEVALGDHRPPVRPSEARTTTEEGDGK